MSEETRERSTTSAGLWPEAQLSDLADSNRWLYFMKGTGSDRDMRLALGVLRQFLQTVTGEFKVIGQDGTTTITNLLMNIAAGTNEVEVKPTYIRFLHHPTGTTSVQELAKLANDSLTIPTPLGTITISNGAVTVTKTESNVTKSVSINKDGVTVTDGTYTALMAKNSVEVSYGSKKASVSYSSVQIEDSETGATTTITEKSVDTNLVTRNYDGTYSGTFSSSVLSASDIVQTLVGVSSAMVVSNSSSSSPKFFFDHAPAVGYEIVVDYQDTNLQPLEVFSGSSSGSSQSICYQASNTVRRYEYKGSTTGWVCKY